MTKYIIKHWKYSLAFGCIVTLLKKVFSVGFSLELFSKESVVEIIIVSATYLLISIAFDPANDL